MKRFWILGAALLISIAVGTIFAQELGLLGRYDDARYIKQTTEDTNQIVFARLIYNGRIPGYYKNWYTDYPDADHHLIEGLKRLTNLNIADHERAVAINDPDLFRYPFLYTSEPEQMVLTDDDAAIMREYLERGGFWILDDFWGSFEWQAMERQLRKILPMAEIKDIPHDHTIFHQFYDIDKIIQVTNNGIAECAWCDQWENGPSGKDPKVFAVLDRYQRIMVLMAWNNDFGDGLEWADDPRYPESYSKYSFKFVTNVIVYAMTH